MDAFIYPPVLVRAAVSGTSVTPERLAEMLGETARPDLLGMTGEIANASQRVPLKEFAQRWALSSKYTPDEQLAFLRMLAGQSGGVVVELDAPPVELAAEVRL